MASYNQYSGYGGNPYGGDGGQAGGYGSSNPYGSDAGNPYGGGYGQVGVIQIAVGEVQDGASTNLRCADSNHPRLNIKCQTTLRNQTTASLKMPHPCLALVKSNTSLPVPQ